MEKFKVKDELFDEYKTLLSTGQNIEANVGSYMCKIYELADLRKQVKAELKKWFDKVCEEYNLDKKKDYFVTPDGIVNESTVSPDPIKPEVASVDTPSKEGGTVADLV